MGWVVKNPEKVLCMDLSFPFILSFATYIRSLVLPAKDLTVINAPLVDYLSIFSLL